MDTSNFSDPIKIGPGIWFSIHINAVKSTNDFSKTYFESFVNDLCDNFKCKKCQPHFRKFIDTHPLSTYWNIYDQQGRDIGFFKWSWELHNEVNKFLKKYQPSLEEAYDYYSDSNAGICFDCDSKITTKNIPILVPVDTHTDNKISKPFRLISRS